MRADPTKSDLQPDSDASFRHQPGGVIPGSVVVTPPQPTIVPGDGKDPQSPRLFHLAQAEAMVFNGGQLQGANEENWPLLQDQQCAIYSVVLEAGGIREPHWHPSAWEVNFILSGRANWTFVGPDSTEDTFTANVGDVVFAPQGHFHYFANASDTEELRVLIVFNSSAAEPRDDIGLVQSFSSLPREVLAAVFGAPAEVFDQIPKTHGRVVITKRE